VLGLIDPTFFQLCDACLPPSSVNRRCGILSHCTQWQKIGYSQKSHGLEGIENEDKDGKKKTKWMKGGGGNDGSQFIDLGNMVKNGSPNTDQKIQGQKYKQFFTPVMTQTTPHFNATGLVTCNKWHCQGFCYEKCERKVSHKNFDSAVHRSAFDKWAKEWKAKNP